MEKKTLVVAALAGARRHGGEDGGDISRQAKGHVRDNASNTGLQESQLAEKSEHELVVDQVIIGLEVCGGSSDELGVEPSSSEEKGHRSGCVQCGERQKEVVVPCGDNHAPFEEVVASCGTRGSCHSRRSPRFL